MVSANNKVWRSKVFPGPKQSLNFQVIGENRANCAKSGENDQKRPKSGPIFQKKGLLLDMSAAHLCVGLSLLDLKFGAKNRQLTVTSRPESAILKSIKRAREFGGFRSSVDRIRFPASGVPAHKRI